MKKIRKDKQMKTWMTKVTAVIGFLVFIFGSVNVLAEDLTVGNFVKDVKINGFVSTSYNYNFNEPSSNAINFRPFNDKDNSFILEVVELVFQKEASGPGDVGFRMDLNFGSTIPKAIQSTGLDSNTDQFDLQQGYLTWVAPIWGGLTLDFGKFITELGAEVIEGYDGWNFNYSRSLLFYYTIPFTHTGLRASMNLTDSIRLIAGVVNGYDNVVDNNRGKSIFVHSAIALTENTLLNLKYIGGPEQDDNNSNLRHVFNINLNHDFLEKFTLNLDLVYGEEDSAVIVGQDAVWQGVSGIIRYTYNDTFAISLRGEYFEDKDGARTETAQNMWEVTVTPEFTVAGNLVIRPEYRHDASDKNVFDHGDNAASKKSQDVLGINIIYHF